MKGIVFDILERVISDAHGEDTWDAILETAGLPGAYTAVGSYEDSEMHALVVAASDSLSKTPDEVLRWFGGAAMPVFAQKYPRFFEEHTTTLSFLKTLNQVIHPEVRKLFPGAFAPEFTFSEQDGVLALGYRSHRGMCSFAEGLIDGAAEHFGESVDVTQPTCQKHGSPDCLIVVRATGAA